MVQSPWLSVHRSAFNRHDPGQGRSAETIPDSPPQAAHRDDPNTIQQIFQQHDSRERHRPVWTRLPQIESFGTKLCQRFWPSWRAASHSCDIKMRFFCRASPTVLERRRCPQGCWACTQFCLYGNDSFLPGPFCCSHFLFTYFWSHTAVVTGSPHRH